MNGALRRLCGREARAAGRLVDDVRRLATTARLARDAAAATGDWRHAVTYARDVVRAGALDDHPADLAVVREFRRQVHDYSRNGEAGR